MKNLNFKMLVAVRYLEQGSLIGECLNGTAQVHTVLSYQEAMAKLRLEVFDLIVTDLHLQNDGIITDVLDFLRWVKGDAAIRKTPFVCFSNGDFSNIGQAQDEVRATARYLGASRYICMENFNAPVFAQEIQWLLQEDRIGGYLPIPEMNTLADMLKDEPILIVDDAVINRIGTGLTVRSIGYVADEADCGAVALKMLKAQRYGAILMDFEMPDMNGLECTRKIREGETGTKSRIPIIAFSSCDEALLRKTCLDGGMDEYLMKSCSTVQLGTVLRRFLPWNFRLSSIHRMNSVIEPKKTST
jgi:CheY-like chemotaxis protein